MHALHITSNHGNRLRSRRRRVTHCLRLSIKIIREKKERKNTIKQEDEQSDHVSNEWHIDFPGAEGKEKSIINFGSKSERPGEVDKNAGSVGPNWKKQKKHTGEKEEETDVIEESFGSRQVG